jgi:hypothetical protein
VSAEPATQFSADDAVALPSGTVLADFRVERLLGEGGFGIVYLARDMHLERLVAVKEYMPASLAKRNAQSHVTVRSERHRETFELGRRSFINEAKLLAQLDHASLVKVLRYWEDRGTAYMAMPYYQGDTLKQRLLDPGVSVDEAWLKALLAPLMDALEHLHARDLLHRDIAPDNIILQSSGAPLLLDFGAARQVITDATQALTVILKPGYAPIEQYAEAASMRQGPWTDIYALAAVMYFAVAKRPPQPSVGRVLKDDLESAALLGQGRFSKGFLAWIDTCLSLRPENRPASIAQARALLLATADDVTVLVAPTPARAPTDDHTVLMPAPPVARPQADRKPTGQVQAAAKTSPALKPAWVMGGAAALGLAGVALWYGVGSVPAVAPAKLTTPTLTPTPAATQPASAPSASTISSPAPSPPPLPVPSTASSTPTTATAQDDLPPAAATKPTVAPTAAPRSGATRTRPERAASNESQGSNPSTTPNNANECAALLARASMGDASPALLERLKAAKCR